MIRYLQTVAVSMVIMALAGCHLINQNNSLPPTTPDDVVVVESPPKPLTTDWRAILSPLIDELIGTMAVSGNDTLLISDINNHSNQYVSSTAINNLLVSMLNQQTIFQVIDNKTVNIAKQHLGMPSDDSLVSRGKMIALARQVSADYVLFTTINQTPKLPDIPAEVSLELILTKTGEIVWQFSSDQLANNQK